MWIEFRRMLSIQSLRYEPAVDTSDASSAMDLPVDCHDVAFEQVKNERLI